MDIQAAVFDADAIDPTVAATNAKIISMYEAENAAKEKWWIMGADAYRKKREAGSTAFPKPVHLPNAKTIEVPSREEGRNIQIRVFVPQARIIGLFLHIHGGGWVLSNAQAQDPFLNKISEEAGVIVASIEYRLAPEHPSPAAEHDCFDVAHWLFSPASTSVFSQSEAVRRNIFIGGESAGAHLSAITMLALRDRHRQHFSGAILNYGVFDLSGTPSARASTVPLVLRWEDIYNFLKAFKPEIYDNVSALRQPETSPLSADLSGLCPALFSCGTVDALIDDSTFMAARYLAAGNQCSFKLYPGAPHGKFTDVNFHFHAWHESKNTFLL